MIRIVLIGGHPKGFGKPFHEKTKSGIVLRKIFDELKINPELFNLWKTQAEEDSRVLSRQTKNNLQTYLIKGHTLIALGRYIEKAIKDNGFDCDYLPHPASRDHKYIKQLKSGLAKIYNLDY